MTEFTEETKGTITYTEETKETVKAITGATKANPCVVTIVGHGYTTGDEVKITDVIGMTELNNTFYNITVLTADTFSLNDTDSSAYTVYTSAGICITGIINWTEETK